jgi:large subunit ribosomal protein L18
MSHSIEQKRKKRKERVTINIKKLNKGQKPILYVFRSNKNIRAQIIDTIGNVLISVVSDAKQFDKELKNKKGVEIAEIIGGKIAKEALAKDIKEVVFNKGRYKYIGRIKAFCEGARKNGLLF